MCDEELSAAYDAKFSVSYLWGLFPALASFTNLSTFARSKFGHVPFFWVNAKKEGGGRGGDHFKHLPLSEERLRTRLKAERSF